MPLKINTFDPHATRQQVRYIIFLTIVSTLLLLIFPIEGSSLQPLVSMLCGSTEKHMNRCKHHFLRFYTLVVTHTQLWAIFFFLSRWILPSCLHGSPSSSHTCSHVNQHWCLHLFLEASVFAISLFGCPVSSALWEH